jgi:NADPH:quinone reductase-like Zn-dependent oxidoreductase
MISHCIGLMTAKATDGAFQHYATIPSLASTRIPDSLPFVNAVVLPLSLNTAATGLYKHLGLPYPTAALTSSPSTSVIVIWGASSSCGSSAVQLAIASGAAVVATASSKNFDYVKGLVPKHKRSEIVLVDHSDPQAVEKIIEVVQKFQAQGKEFRGAFDLIHGDALPKVVEIRSKLGGGDVPTVMWPQGEFPENVKVNLGK